MIWVVANVVASIDCGNISKDLGSLFYCHNLIPPMRVVQSTVPMHIHLTVKNGHAVETYICPFDGSTLACLVIGGVCRRRFGVSPRALKVWKLPNHVGA